ncbi:MAG: dihydropteroate synthase [Puia sp.]|nr:dihydropteroate synthase [Puia sp.]
MYTLNCKGRLLVIDRPFVMAIINATPDSFYAGSRIGNREDLLRQAAKMIEEGADILDVGGQSTRPGAEEVGETEELKRVIGAIDGLHRHFPDIPLSVDTYYSKVAREAVAAGASIVNDISGGALDPDMLAVVGQLGVPYICTHSRGTPQTMTRQADYDNVTTEVLDFLIRRTEDCRKAGIQDLIIDPGLGFAKGPRHNFELVRNLHVFGILRKPILLGISRKSMIYKTLDIPIEEALNGTTVLNTLGLLNGASILRVHDPKQAKEAITLLAAYSG